MVLTEGQLSDQRVQTSFLAKPERKVLLWIAPRRPRWVSPDMLTFLGLLGLGLCGLTYYFATKHWIYLVISSLGQVINWVGDSLDGTLARVRNKQRPKYGFYIDHLIDAFGISLMMFGLAYSGLVTGIFVWAVLALFFIASINTYLATTTVGVFKISYLRISTTEARVGVIIMNTVLIFVKRITLFGFTFLWLDVLGILIIFFLLVAIIRSAIKNLRQLDKIERAKWEKQ
jgi:phosphatidylglycerophosphate synthase